MEKESPLLNETAQTILEAHFERFTINSIAELVDGWRQQGQDIGFKNALGMLCSMINKSRSEALIDLNKYFVVEPQEEASPAAAAADDRGEEVNKSRVILDAISSQSSGELVNDPIWNQCAKLSIKVGVDKAAELQLHDEIGRYFRSRTNSYLLEHAEYGKSYNEIKTEFDRISPSSSSPESSPRSAISSEPIEIPRPKSAPIPTSSGAVSTPALPRLSQTP